jgi:two-component system response regulator
MKNFKKIILAEDNIADVELTKLAFKELNLNIEVCHVLDGQLLMDRLKQQPIDDIALILLDLNMPKLGGLDVLKQMYGDEELSKLPVVVFTSSLHESDVHACYEYGANAYVSKPIDINDFHKTIAAIANFWTEINVLPAFNGVNF